MKKLQPFLVPISEIICKTTNEFNPVQIQRAAQLIMQSGEVINPLILRRVSIDSYELLNGTFEYFAAAEAKKLNPLQCGNINAYILEAEIDLIVMEQIKLFRPTISTTPLNPLNLNTQPMQEEQITKFEQRLESLFDRMISKLEQRLETKFNALENKVETTTLEPKLELIVESESIPEVPVETSSEVPVETSSEVPVETSIVILDSTQESPPAQVIAEESTLKAMPIREELGNEDRFLQFLNAATLQELKDLGTDIRDDTLRGIINQREKDGQYKSREDCVERLRARKRFSKTQYDKLANKWNEKIAMLANDGSENQALQSQAQLDIMETIPIDDTTAIAVNTDEINNGTTETKTPPRSRSASKSKSLRGIDKLNNMNKAELAQILNRLKFSKKLIEAILEQRPFASFDTTNIPGLGPKKVQALRDEFEK